MLRPDTGRVAAELLGFPPPPDGATHARRPGGVLVNMQATSIMDLIRCAQDESQLQAVWALVLKTPASPGTRRKWHKAMEERLGALRAGRITA